MKHKQKEIQRNRNIKKLIEIQRNEEKKKRTVEKEKMKG